MTAPTVSSSSICLLLLSVVVLPGCEHQVFTGKREARGVWMSRFEYTSDSTGGRREASQAYIRRIFEHARRARLNMVFFQVRGNADAFYRSSLEPWSSMLSGRLGADPGWDPLDFAIGEARRSGLELHAWVNTFPVWRGPALPGETTPRPIVLEHPEWIACDSAGRPMPLGNTGYVWGSPGNPSLRSHIVSVVREIVERYDVDGIHFDYIRYPEGTSVHGWSRDSVSLARFADPASNPQGLAWEEWQRDQVTAFVSAAYDTITSRKPWVKMSAAVIGKYDGSGWTSYHAVLQDPRGWMEREKIDFVVPMVYWERSHPTHPFIPLIAQWQDRRARGRLVLPGLSTGLEKKFGWREIAAQISAVREQGLPGVVFFASGGLERAWETLGVDEFPYWALPPAMPWKDSIPPLPPSRLSASRAPDGIRLQWEADTTEPVSFVVYRYSQSDFDRNNALRILTVTGRNILSCLDSRPLTERVLYIVTAVDRVWNESTAGAFVEVPPGSIAGISGTIPLSFQSP